MLLQRWMWIAWPAFLLAGVQEMLVFAVIDPHDLTWAGEPLPLSRTGIYTVAFFVFWALMTAATAMTTLLSLSPFEINRCPVPVHGRPDACRGDSEGKCG